MDRKQIQHERNAESRHQWLQFTNHRRRITAEILRLGRSLPAREICILGAGNCNDVTLDELIQNDFRLTLVDIDGVALTHARDSLPRERRSCVELVPDEDLSRVDAMREHESAFDMTCSIGLVSQLIEQTIPSSSNASQETIEATIRQTRIDHLETIINLTKSGGAGMLVWEVVSSITCPEIVDCEDHLLPGLLRRALESRNFFSGLHPRAVLQSLDDLQLCGVSQAQILDPWKWHFLDRVYAVTAMTFYVAK